jgi:hypothetical protein
MASDVVTTVNEVVAHDIDIVNRFEDLRSLLLGEGNEILLTARGGDGEDLVVTNGLADGSEELGVGFDLADFLGVGNVFVVLAVATGIFPVDVWINVLVFCLCGE